MPKLIRARIASTHVDLHGDALTVGALHGIVDQVRERYIPVLWNHDVRYPPLGRIVEARVVALDDGEFALDIESENWESADRPDTVHSDGRKLAVDARPHDGFEVTFDRGFSGDPAAMDLIGAIRKLGRESEPQRAEKKALEPIATLVVSAGVFAAGAIATGFIGQIGADAYKQVQHRLKALFEDREAILDFHFGVRGPSSDYEVHVLVDPPSSTALDGVFDSEFAELDRLVDNVVDRHKDVAKLVVFWRDGSMSFGYALRSDGFPVEVEWTSVPRLRRTHSDGSD